MRDWVVRISTVVGVACRNMKDTYVSLKKSLQQEWYFVQCYNQRLVY